MAGGWKNESANDTCALKIAKDSVFLLSSSDEFQSRLDATLEDCNMEIEELITAERQVLGNSFLEYTRYKCNHKTYRIHSKSLIHDL